MSVKIDNPNIPEYVLRFRGTIHENLIPDYLLNHIFFKLDVFESNLWASTDYRDYEVELYEQQIKAIIYIHANELSKEA